MKQTLKDLYNIDTNSMVKYTDKVYKIKSSDKKDYCLKYSEKDFDYKVIEKINALKLNDCFIMPIKTCIRSNIVQKNDKYFYVSDWVDDDYIESKDLKIKYYLNQIAILHNRSSYTINVSSSFYNELFMKLNENIEEKKQKYENIIYIIERKEYKSPFEWYFINNFNKITSSLSKSLDYLEKFKNSIKDKNNIRQVITHQNFSFDHVFITKNKIIGNDKINLASPIEDLIYIFNNIDFNSLDISGLINEYTNSFTLEEYEIYWLLIKLFIVDDLYIDNNEINNIDRFMKIILKYKSVLEIEKILITKK